MAKKGSQEPEENSFSHSPKKQQPLPQLFIQALKAKLEEGSLRKEILKNIQIQQLIWFQKNENISSSPQKSSKNRILSTFKDLFVKFGDDPENNFIRLIQSLASQGKQLSSFGKTKFSRLNLSKKLALTMKNQKKTLHVSSDKTAKEEIEDPPKKEKKKDCEKSFGDLLYLEFTKMLEDFFEDEEPQGEDSIKSEKKPNEKTSEDSILSNPEKLQDTIQDFDSKKTHATPSQDTTNILEKFLNEISDDNSEKELKIQEETKHPDEKTQDPPPQNLADTLKQFLSKNDHPLEKDLPEIFEPFEKLHTLIQEFVQTGEKDSNDLEKKHREQKSVEDTKEKASEDSILSNPEKLRNTIKDFDSKNMSSSPPQDLTNMLKQFLHDNSSPPKKSPSNTFESSENSDKIKQAPPQTETNSEKESKEVERGKDVDKKVSEESILSNPEKLRNTIKDFDSRKKNTSSKSLSENLTNILKLYLKEISPLKKDLPGIVEPFEKLDKLIQGDFQTKMKDDNSSKKELKNQKEINLPGIKQKTNDLLEELFSEVKNLLSPSKKKTSKPQNQPEDLLFKLLNTFSETAFKQSSVKNAKYNLKAGVNTFFEEIENTFQEMPLEKRKKVCDSIDSLIKQSEKSFTPPQNFKKTIGILDKIASKQKILKSDLEKEMDDSQLIDMEMLSNLLENQNIPMYYIELNEIIYQYRKEILLDLYKEKAGDLREKAYYITFLRRLAEYLYRNFSYCPLTKDEMLSLQKAWERNKLLPLKFLN